MKFIKNKQTKNTCNAWLSCGKLGCRPFFRLWWLHHGTTKWIPETVPTVIQGSEPYQDVSESTSSYHSLCTDVVLFSLRPLSIFQACLTIHFTDGGGGEGGKVLEIRPQAPDHTGHESLTVVTGGFTIAPGYLGHYWEKKRDFWKCARKSRTPIKHNMRGGKAVGQHFSYRPCLGCGFQTMLCGASRVLGSQGHGRWESIRAKDSGLSPQMWIKAFISFMYCMSD